MTNEPRTTSNWIFKSANALHHGVLKLSGGRFGWHLSNMPVVELTTTGRKSGLARSVMLTSPMQEGDTIVVVASRNGDDQNPAWLLNLRDNPEVEVAMRGKPKRPMQARVATPEERARLWPLIVADFKNYGDYQTKTDREIPLVLIEPRA